MYFAVVIILLIGFTWMNAIGAYLAAFLWAVICGLVCFEVAKFDAERWKKLDGRA